MKERLNVKVSSIAKKECNNPSLADYLGDRSHSQSENFQDERKVDLKVSSIAKKECNNPCRNMIIFG